MVNPANLDAASLRVLVVDDQSTMRSIVRRLLDQIGIRDIDEAEDGAEALEHLQDPEHSPPDLVICDLHMDKLDGMELLNLIRRGEGQVDKTIPFIILTGDSTKLVHEVARQLGATRVLTKPVTATDLWGHIQAAVGYAVGV